MRFGKMGRPNKDNPRSLRVNVRLTPDEYGLILDIINRTGGKDSHSQVLRAALRYYYHMVFGDFGNQ